jgi:hypothetical protein
MFCPELGEHIQSNASTDEVLRRGFLICNLITYCETLNPFLLVDDVFPK